MPCYPCTHCNKCGIYSIRLELTCATCGADVIQGEAACQTCHTPYAGNTKRGRMGKPKGSNDYYTSIDKSQGVDAYKLKDMSDL